MQRRTVGNILLLCIISIAVTGLIRCSNKEEIEILETPKNNESVVILNESGENSNSQENYDTPYELYPEVYDLITYLCDNDWNEFKGGCSWYCVAKVPTLDATSELSTQNNISFVSQNAHDFDLDSVWSEGVEGYGIGESLILNVKGNQNNLSITHVEIINGYIKSEKLGKKIQE